MTRGAVIAAITVVLGGLASVYILHPFTPGFAQDGLDASWIAAMSDAADRHARWGVDLAFTYGPATPLVVNVYNGDYFTHTLPLLTFFALVFGWCAALIVVRPGRSLRGIACGTLAVAGAIVSAKGTVDAFYLTLPLLAFLLAIASERPSRARRAAMMAAGFAMGVAAMTKMSFPLAALSLFLIADVSAVLRRRLPLLLVPFALGVVTGDLFYGQRLSDLPAYLAFQGEVVAGYAGAMALPGPIWDLGAFLVAGAVLVAAGLWAAWRDGWRHASSWLAAIGVVIDLFFLFKAGFIRHDLHSLIAWRGLVIVAVLLALGSLLPRQRWATLAVTGVALIVALVYAPVLTVRQSSQKPRGAAFAQLYGGWLADGPPEQVAAALALLRDPAAFRRDLDQQAADARAAIAEAHPLGALPGSVDVLPSLQSRLIAAGLDYRPRPSFQEYSTYTERLAQANRAFVEGPRAPDWILFGPESGIGWMSIDGRYPNLAEGALWPDLLRLYRPDHRIGSLLALKRRAEPMPLPIGSARTVVAGFNTPVPVSAAPENAVWATIDARLNLFGRVASLLFRPPLPGLVVRLDDGETRWFRFVPDLGRAGLVVSPIVFNASDFADLAQGRAAAPKHRVVAVSIDASRATAAFYDSEIRFGFSPIDTSALRDDKVGPMPAPAGTAWDRLVATRPGSGLDPTSHIPAEAPSMIELPSEGLGRMTLAYGIDDGAWQDAHTSGVCFAISPSDGLHAALWQTCLDPLDRPEDRGSHTVSLDVPKGTTELALETTCRGPCGAGWAYWAKSEAEAGATR